MKKNQFITILLTVFVTVLFTLIILPSCELIFENEHFDYSEYDALNSVEDSGKLKWEYWYGSSDDETIDTGIEFIYDENKNLVEKQYRHFYDNKPTSYDIKEFFIYNEVGKLTKMERHIAQGTDDTSFLLIRYSLYSYPEQGIKMETKFDDTGVLKDSIIFNYNGDLLISEKHYNQDGYWEMNYEYNNSGKLETIFDSFTNRSHKYIYDENELLVKIEDWADEEIKTILYYEREQKNNVLIIRSHRDQENEPQKNYLGQTKYVDGKLYELVHYHPGFPGSEWWCIRYVYLD
ncbi:MAG: hypothetical protein JXR31_00415 [Prolixibacteraceae bacterium]|nr:hypothetical protein [Prolixibacteraceae bacterium]